jgi:hypothetical protein
MKKYFPALLLIFITFGQNVAFGQISQSPTTVAKNFYAKYLELKIRGLPDSDQLKGISPFFSSEIIAIIKADLRKQERFIKKHPDEKPPWNEGDLFSSLFEGATSYKIGATRVTGNAAQVDVKLTNAEGTPQSTWNDTALLKLTGGRWAITNILFKGKWQFKSGGSLLKALK